MAYPLSPHLALLLGRALVVALLCLVAAAAQALPVPSAPLGRVSDFAGLLDEAAKSSLEARLAAIEAETSNQFAVAVFRSLEGEPLEDFSIRLGEAWKVGHKGRDNGILLLVFTEDRKVRIEVGYGLEGAIPDAVASRVIREVIGPRFRDGDFAGGLRAAVDTLDAASRGEFEALPRRRGGSGAVAGFLPFLLLVALLGVVSALNRAAHLGRRSVRHHPRGVWWGGGLGGGGFGRGGGFGGGGGGFGGGGASGGW